MKTKITPQKITGWTMLIIGILALATSIIYTSLILAFIGLGLVFWGAVLTYIQTEEYVKKSLLDATIQPSLTMLNQLIEELDYEGTAIYLPPKYFQQPETVKIYIPKNKTTRIPLPEEIQKYEKQIFTQNPRGLLLTPPGAELTKLFEETLETSFTKLNIEQMQNSLQKLLVEDFEIAENLEIQTETGKTFQETDNQTTIPQTKQDTICIKITNTIYKNICMEAKNLPHVCQTTGCSLCSAIACAIAKATGKPVIIENTQLSKEGKTIEGTYRILKTAELQEQVGEGIKTQIAVAHYSRLSKLAGVSLIGLGAIILSLVGWITFYDITVWGKSLELIFLGSRTGEAIDLGIGMKVLHYFGLGLASTLIGVLVLIRRRSKRRQAISSIKPAEE
jgi:hypothetical protein